MFSFKKKVKNMWGHFTIISVVVLLLYGCSTNVKKEKVIETTNETVAMQTANETTNIRIITTSDIHGKMVPWDYIDNKEYRVGSLA